jgi:hypothetical protein
MMSAIPMSLMVILPAFLCHVFVVSKIGADLLRHHALRGLLGLHKRYGKTDLHGTQ